MFLAHAQKCLTVSIKESKVLRAVAITSVICVFEMLDDDELLDLAG